MSAIDARPHAPRRASGLDVGAVSFLSLAGEPVICDGCQHATRTAVGLARDWQPTLWFCAACIVDRLDPA